MPGIPVLVLIVLTLANLLTAGFWKNGQVGHYVLRTQRLRYYEMTATSILLLGESCWYMSPWTPGYLPADLVTPTAAVLLSVLGYLMVFMNRSTLLHRAEKNVPGLNPTEKWFLTTRSYDLYTGHRAAAYNNLTGNKEVLRYLNVRSGAKRNPYDDETNALAATS